MFCTLIIAGRFIAIPLLVPITMQFLFVNTGALILGRKGYIPPLCYLLLGLIGVPVFTTGGGLGSIVEYSFGFIIGFVAGAFVTGVISEKAKSTLGIALASAAGLVCVYACGIGYCFLLSRIYFHQSTPAHILLYSFCLPFIIPDTVKCALSIILFKKLKKHIKIQPTDHA